MLTMDGLTHWLVIPTIEKNAGLNNVPRCWVVKWLTHFGLSLTDHRLTKTNNR